MSPATRLVAFIAALTVIFAATTVAGRAIHPDFRHLDGVHTATFVYDVSR